MTPPISIKWHVTESRKSGYRWTCRLCGAAGFHGLDRWTDYVAGLRGRSHPHPQQRCVMSSAAHLLRTHAGQRITVTVHLGGQP